MKISKHIHSCLLVEEKNQTVLFDPGDFSYENKALDISKLTRLNYILITHQHADHCHPPFIQELVSKFPDAKIITNPSVQTFLKTANLVSETSGNEYAALVQTPHEKIWSAQQIENTTFTLFNKLTHPGDSLHFTRTAEILALPLTAPWGSTTAMIEKALDLKPKIIIPIHDYLWRDEIRMGMYKRLTNYFANLGIQFKGIETGEVIEV